MINCSIDISGIFSSIKKKMLSSFLKKIIEKSNEIELLKHVNFSIKIVNKEGMDKVSKDYIHATPVGMFDTTNMTIYVLYEKDICYMEDTYFHELGHLIDFVIGKEQGMNGCYSENYNISEVMEADKRFLDYIYADIPKECFAQSFSECYRHTNNSVMMFKTKEMFRKLNVA